MRVRVKLDDENKIVIGKNKSDLISYTYILGQTETETEIEMGVRKVPSATIEVDMIRNNAKKRRRGNEEEHETEQKQKKKKIHQQKKNNK